MKFAILSLGLWLAGAQGFGAQACCFETPTPKAACGNCGDTSDRESSSTPDCCTSIETPKDIDLAAVRNTLPENPVIIELLPLDSTFLGWRPETTDLFALHASTLAEGSPLYLRNSVLLI